MFLVKITLSIVIYQYKFYQWFGFDLKLKYPQEFVGLIIEQLSAVAKAMDLN